MGKGKNKPADEKYGDLIISNMKLQSLEADLANQKCKNFDCSGNFFTNLSYAPGLVTGDFICKNNTMITGEPNPMNQSHLGAGRFDKFGGLESIDTNRPVRVNGSYITDENVYKLPKIYDASVEANVELIKTPKKDWNLTKFPNKVTNPNDIKIKNWLDENFGEGIPPNTLGLAKQMFLSSDIIWLIAKFEGREPKVYDDNPGPNGKYPKSWSQFNGNPTIGIGHLITPNQRSKWQSYLNGQPKSLSAKEMWLLKIEDLKRIVSSMIKHFNSDVLITQGMFDALVSIGFNYGPNKEVNKCYPNLPAAPVGVIKRLLNFGKYDEAYIVIKTQSDCADLQTRRGLINRRHQEAAHIKKYGFITVD